MWKKQTYKIRLGDGEYGEVEGAVHGMWGIDKRSNAYYILTHVPSGCRVESARTMKFLKDLATTPEFECYDKSDESLKKMLGCIARFRNQYGWTA